MTETATLTAERADLLETLAAHRYFLRHTVGGLTDEQARHRTTTSELTLGGLIKHVADTEEKWARFVVEGPAAMAAPTDDAGFEAWADGSAAPRRDARGRPRPVRRRGRADGRAGPQPPRSRRFDPAARGAVVRARRAPFGPPRLSAHRRRDRPARRARRHPPGVPGRPEDDGLRPVRARRTRRSRARARAAGRPVAPAGRRWRAPAERCRTR